MAPPNSERNPSYPLSIFKDQTTQQQKQQQQQQQNNDDDHTNSLPTRMRNLNWLSSSVDFYPAGEYSTSSKNQTVPTVARLPELSTAGDYHSLPAVARLPERILTAADYTSARAAVRLPARKRMAVDKDSMPAVVPLPRLLTEADILPPQSLLGSSMYMANRNYCGLPSSLYQNSYPGFDSLPSLLNPNTANSSNLNLFSPSTQASSLYHSAEHNVPSSSYLDDLQNDFNFGSSTNPKTTLHGLDIVALAKVPIRLRDMGRLLKWGSSVVSASCPPPTGVQPTIFQAVLQNWYDLIIHPYGHKFFRMFINASDSNQISITVSWLAKDQAALFSASCHCHGNYLIRSLIKVAKRTQAPTIGLLLGSLAPSVEHLMKNRNGRCVIQECFEQFDGRTMRPICLKVLEHWMKLALDKDGCLALNKCMETMEPQYKQILLENIAEFSCYLSQQPYGNFVLQEVLGMKCKSLDVKIVQKLRPVFAKLCTMKYGSHVVEKCMRTQYMPSVVDCIVKSGKLLDIARNEFGNYVIQKALKETKAYEDPSLYQTLYLELSKGDFLLETCKYGTLVLNVLRKENSSEGQTEVSY